MDLGKEIRAARTGAYTNPRHIEYEKAFERVLRRKGRQNPEIRRNFYLEDTVEEGNFISRERLVSCARAPGTVVPMEKLFVGIDWARRSDFTWVTISNDENDIIEWFKYPHVSYPEQVRQIKADMEREHTAIVDGKEVKFRYIDRVLGVRGDATGGAGDAPNEILQETSGLPVGEDSFFISSKQGKDRLYVNFATALFKETGDKMRFTYPADHPLAGEIEEQMIQLLRDYTGEGEFLAPDEPDAKDDAPDSTALALVAAAGSKIGEILFA